MDDFIVTVPEDKGPDMGAFAEKMPWTERSELIKKTFPSTVSLDWNEVFKQDPGLMGRIINDMLKADQAEPGRPGKRPALDKESARKKWREIVGDDSVDFTMLPFHRAFKNLCRERSVRHVATKVKLDKSMVHNLLKGEKAPTPEIMERVAEGFGIRPAYFLEYRIAYILGVLFYKLSSQPESSVVFYNKVTGRGGGQNRDS